jgi:hypothetical protein
MSPEQGIKLHEQQSASETIGSKSVTEPDQVKYDDDDYMTFDAPAILHPNSIGKTPSSKDNRELEMVPKNGVDALMASLRACVEQNGGSVPVKYDEEEVSCSSHDLSAYVGNVTSAFRRELFVLHAKLMDSYCDFHEALEQNPFDLFAVVSGGTGQAKDIHSAVKLRSLIVKNYGSLLERVPPNLDESAVPFHVVIQGGTRDATMTLQVESSSEYRGSSEFLPPICYSGQSR